MTKYILKGYMIVFLVSTVEIFFMPAYLFLSIDHKGLTVLQALLWEPWTLGTTTHLSPSQELLCSRCSPGSEPGAEAEGGRKAHRRNSNRKRICSGGSGQSILTPCPRTRTDQRSGFLMPSAWLTLRQHLGNYPVALGLHRQLDWLCMSLSKNKPGGGRGDRDGEHM